MEFRQATEKEIKQIIALDQEMTRSDRRREEIVQAIRENRCLLVYTDGDISGFLIYHAHFFDCCFISLIMIKPVQQRKGLAGELLTYMERISTTEKLFSSTNESNIAMQKVFESNGFRKSGIVENLDEGDAEIIYFKETRGRGAS